MPKIDFTDEERRALADLAREYVRTQRYPLAPRLAPLKAALVKLDPASVPQPSPERVSLPGTLAAPWRSPSAALRRGIISIMACVPTRPSRSRRGYGLAFFTRRMLTSSDRISIR
jgi:hypothetical protein